MIVQDDGIRLTSVFIGCARLCDAPRSDDGNAGRCGGDEHSPCRGQGEGSAAHHIHAGRFGGGIERPGKMEGTKSQENATARVDSCDCPCE